MSLASGDLTTVAAVQAYYPSQGQPAAAVLRGLISRMSRWILNDLNRSFILPTTYVEYFDGSGNGSLVLPNWPLLSLSTLYVDSSALSEATNVGNQYFSSYGYGFQPWNGIPPGNPAVLSLSGGATFYRGTRNVGVTYLAGYQVTDEAGTIPATPFRITPLAPYGIWASDQGVTFLNGTALTAISSGTPTTGQYLPPAPDATVPRDYYTFAAADTGLPVLMSYGFVPADLEQVVLELIIERSAYRTRPGVKSQMLASQETIVYDNSGLSRATQSILSAYRSVLPPAMAAVV